MGENHENPTEHKEENAKVHKVQLLFDNILLLLVLSILMTGLIYAGWEILELFR